MNRASILYVRGLLTASGGELGMKLVKKLIGLGLLALSSRWVGAAEEFALDRPPIVEPSATLSGGAFQLSGTLGQSFVTASGVELSLAPGFWAAPLPQGTPNLRLSIKHSVDGLTITWEPDGRTAVLQSSESVSPAIWSDVISTLGSSFTIKPEARARFYRLRR